jgi:hypothetical protein
MDWRLAAVAALFVASACDQVIPKAAPRTGKGASSEPTALAKDGLPPPKTRASIETKYVRAIPLDGKKPAYLTVEQWLFHVDGEEDGTLICVDNDSHCIPLVKLREQLNRPANDPLGLFEKK